MPLLRQPLPSLVFLNVEFENPHLFQDALKSFPIHSPNIRVFFVRVLQLLQAPFTQIEPGYICCWRNLRFVVCPDVALDRAALMHLSRMPALTWLDVALSATFASSDSPLLFSNLHDMKLHSESLRPTSRLLSQARLPAITEFSADIRNTPSMQELSSFLAGFQISSVGSTIEKLQLNQLFHSSSNTFRSEAALLDFRSLRPWMEFGNLRHLCLNIECNVGLTDSEVLALASGWPQLEHLLINEDWGWNSRSGITPGGLIRLLQTCPSLRQLALPLDTRGYTLSTRSQIPVSIGWTVPSTLSIDVLDSIVEVESLLAVAVFFHGIAVHTHFNLAWWNCRGMEAHPNIGEHLRHWDDVHGRFQSLLLSDGEFDSMDSVDDP